MRRVFGLRRERLRRLQGTLSGLLARRERLRRGRITSLRMLTRKNVGWLFKEESKDIRHLDKVVRDNGGDWNQAMECLNDATLYMEDVLTDPRPFSKAQRLRRRIWHRILDDFLSHLRNIISLKRMEDTTRITMIDVVDMLAHNLRVLKLHECDSLQSMVRFRLEDALELLFDMKPPSQEVVRERLFGY